MHDPELHEARRADAGDAFERSRSGCGYCLSETLRLRLREKRTWRCNSILAAIDQTLERDPPAARACAVRVGVTVDHKKIGLMYIMYGVDLSCDWRDRSDDDADPACGPQQSFCLSAGLQPAVHDARHDDGFLRWHADSVRLRQLPCAADDWRARHGVSAAECVQLLDIGAFGGLLLYFSFIWGRWTCMAPALRRMWAGSPMRR